MTTPTKAKRTKSALAGGSMPNVRKQVMGITGRARKMLARRAKPLEKRAWALSTEVRRMTAGYLHEIGRMLSRLEKTVAPPPARRPRAKRAKAKARPAPTVEVPRPRGAPGEVAA